MKRSLKCYGLLLALPIIFGLSFVVSLDTNALKHDYIGIPYFYPMFEVNYDASSIIPAAGDGGHAGQFPAFNICFNGDSNSNNFFDSLNIGFSASYVPWDTNSFPPFSSNYIRPIFDFYNSCVSTQSIIGYSPDFISLPSNDYYTFTEFGSNGKSQFDNTFSGMLTCDKSNGAFCGGLWNSAEYVNSNILPYWYSSNGFYLKSKAIDSNGVHFSNTFSLSDLFNQDIHSFSHLDIPLFDYGGFFFNKDNLYSGRQFEFKGVFDFDGSFSWHDNINTNGSYFRIDFYGQRLYDTSGSFVDTFSTCDTNLILLDGTTQLEYSCSGSLDSDYLWFAPYLSIDGNGDYVFLTDSDWRFYETFLITDNDSTPGDPFNSNLTGGGTIAGDASNNFSDDNADWFASLTNLFNFNLLNPFAPLFGLFISQDRCVNIPTIAGLIHSEETQVCPWFDSTVRSIVTPVLGISSAMLLFGFVVHWLGSRSGNFVEDAEVTSGGLHFANKFRRKK